MGWKNPPTLSAPGPARLKDSEATPEPASAAKSQMLSYMLHLFSEARIVLCKAHARKNPACPQIWACENPALI